jgi:hypothetical protein
MTKQPDVVVAVEPELLNTEQACAMLGGISPDKLKELRLAGEIGAKTIGRRIVFPVAEVRRFARECPSWEPKQSI